MPVICPERASRNFIPSSYGTPSLALGSTGVCVVNSDCVVPVEGAETVNVAVALVSPVATRQARDVSRRVPDDVCSRIKADFEEMPDLTVTTRQAARFWVVDEHLAAAALQCLEERGILRQTRLGFRRSS